MIHTYRTKSRKVSNNIMYMNDLTSSILRILQELLESNQSLGGSYQYRSGKRDLWGVPVETPDLEVGNSRIPTPEYDWNDCRSSSAIDTILDPRK